MTTRHLVLAITAFVVLGMGVYLFVAVRSSPEQVASAPTAPREPDPPPASADDGAAKPPSPRTVQGRPQMAIHTPAAAGAESAPPQLEGSSDDANEPPIDDLMKANPKLDAVMDRANKAYDRQDYEEARQIAAKVLAKQPTNIRMLRIMVSSACIDGDTAIATKYFPQLPKFDRDQLKSRCDRYGVTLTDPQ